MKNFKVGDRVICTVISYDGMPLLNKTGTIHHWHHSHSAAVVFDEFIGGHDFEGARKGHGWNVPIDCLKRLNDIMKVKEWLLKQKGKQWKSI